MSVTSIKVGAGGTGTGPVLTITRTVEDDGVASAGHQAVHMDIMKYA